MKEKLLLFWDKYFFHIFFFFLTLFIISALWLFIAKPDIACTELTEESKLVADEIDREKQCFNIWEMKLLEEYNDYLAEKYPPPKAEDNYFIDRLNVSGNSKWLND